MQDFLSNIKEDLRNMSDAHIMITLTRNDVEKLVKAYERLKREVEKK